MLTNLETLSLATMLTSISENIYNLSMIHIKQDGNESKHMKLILKRKGNKFICRYPDDKKNKNWNTINVNIPVNCINFGDHTFKLTDFIKLTTNDNGILMDTSLPNCRKVNGTQRKLKLINPQ